MVRSSEPQSNLVSHKSFDPLDRALRLRVSAISRKTPDSALNSLLIINGHLRTCGLLDGVMRKHVSPHEDEAIMSIMSRWVEADDEILNNVRTGFGYYASGLSVYHMVLEDYIEPLISRVTDAQDAVANFDFFKISECASGIALKSYLNSFGRTSPCSRPT